MSAPDCGADSLVEVEKGEERGEGGISQCYTESLFQQMREMTAGCVGLAPFDGKLWLDLSKELTLELKYQSPKEANVTEREGQGLLLG